MKYKILTCKCHKIDSNGKVYSKWVQFAKKGTKGIQSKISNKWIILNCVKNPQSGYIQINLHGRIVRVNRLIANNFIKNPECYPEVQHKDGNKENNSILNLKWGNQKHNAEDRILHGNNCIGVMQPSAKLNDAKVRKIRKERCIKSLNVLAREFGVSQKCILLVCQNKTWKHVK